VTLLAASVMFVGVVGVVALAEAAAGWGCATGVGWWLRRCRWCPLPLLTQKLERAVPAEPTSP
jgi:hypothetical protein